MENDLLFILIALLLILFLIVGILPSKNNTNESFLISNRNLGAFSNAFSIAASKIGAGLLVTYSTFFFLYGWPAFFYFLGIIFGYLLFFKFALGLKDESDSNKYYTLADYFDQKYGRNTGRVIGLVTTISVFGWVLTNLVAGGKLLTTLTDVPILTTTFSIAVVIGIYLYMGGFDSVIRTDKIQFIALVLIAAVFCVIMINGIEFTPSSDELQNIPPLSVAGFFILGILFPMGSAELWQRVYAARDKVKLKQSILIAGIAYVILGLFISIICVSVLNSGTELMSLSNEEKLAMGVKNLVFEIHPVLPIIWIMAFVSAIISSADTFVYTTASALVQDIFKNKRSKDSSDESSASVDKKRILVRNIRRAIVFLLVIALVISQIVHDVRELTIIFVGITLVLSSLTYISILDKKHVIPSFWLSLTSVFGVLIVISHFIYSEGKSEVVTSLLGAIITFVILGIILLFNRNRN